MDADPIELIDAGAAGGFAALLPAQALAAGLGATYGLTGRADPAGDAPTP